MTKFYETMPAELPKTLPAGTRISNGWVFIGEAKLDNCASYGAAYGDCEVRYDNGVARGSSRVCLARQVVWAEVPLPAQAPVEPRVEPCRNMAGHEVVAPHCFNSLNICVYCGYGKPARGPSVDGPELDCHCGHAGCSRCDRPTDAPLCSTPACAARGVTATHCLETSEPYCVYCSNETEEGNGERGHIDMVTSMQMLKGEMSDGSRIPGELAARTRMAAMDRAERPRANPAEARELSKPHPWSCDEDV